MISGGRTRTGDLRVMSPPRCSRWNRDAIPHLRVKGPDPERPGPGQPGQPGEQPRRPGRSPWPGGEKNQLDVVTELGHDVASRKKARAGLRSRCPLGGEIGTAILVGTQRSLRPLGRSVLVAGRWVKRAGITVLGI